MELTFSSTSTSTWEGSYYLDINRVEKSSVSASFSFLEQDAALQVLGGQSPGGQSWPVSHHEKQVWGPFGAWQRVGVTRSSRETIPSTIKFTGNILEKKGKAGLVRGWGSGEEGVTVYWVQSFSLGWWEESSGFGLWGWLHNTWMYFMLPNNIL